VIFRQDVPSRYRAPVSPSRPLARSALPRERFRSLLDSGLLVVTASAWTNEGRNGESRCDLLLFQNGISSLRSSAGDAGVAGSAAEVSPQMVSTGTCTVWTPFL
jgi:hypothetical protein